jgi:two-component system, OmpR family, sensor kinase
VLKPHTLRGRLALIFGLTTTLLAAGFGLILLHQAREQLARAIDEGLIPVSSDLTRRLEAQGPHAIEGEVPAITSPSDAFAQVLNPDGRLIASSDFPGNQTPLLSRAEAAAASPTRLTKRDSTIPKNPRRGQPLDPKRRQPVRLLASAVRPGGTPLVLVVGTSFDESLSLEEELEFTLGAGLPILAAAVALGGWLLTGAMFKPVRSLIEQADTISASEAGTRLALAGGGDELIGLSTRLNAMLDRIHDAAARERAFLDDASHELRTPIAILRGQLELTRDRLGDSGGPGVSPDQHEELRGAIDSVLDEAERLDRMAHNLLVLARSRSGSLDENASPVDLETVIDRARRAIARRAGTRHVQVDVHGNGVVIGDELALERAMINLLDNAVRFAAQHISVTIGDRNGWVSVEVSDDGPGFDLAFIPHAFDRYTRGPVATGNGRSGTGLGLAITAAVVVAHGGEVEAENTPDGGALVRLILPPA